MGYAVTVGQPMLALDFRPQHSCYFLKNWDPWWPQGELIGLEVVAGSERDVLVLTTSQHRCLAVRQFCVYVALWEQ